MKMKPADYANLQAEINYAVESGNLNIRKRHAEYQEKGLSAERFAWDLLWWSGANVVNFYSYLNDNHISTALLKITKELLDS